MPRLDIRHSLHPPLHLLLLHTRATGTRTHSHAPLSETTQQPTSPVPHLTTGLAIYAYLPMNPCRLPQPSPVDLVFFSDASGESALMCISGGATLQLIQTEGHYHMDHHTAHTTYAAYSHGELAAIADTITKIAAHLPALLPHVVRVWLVVDATVDTHLLLRIA